jgi:hypothetical protein
MLRYSTRIGYAIAAISDGLWAVFKMRRRLDASKKRMVDVPPMSSDSTICAKD